MNSSKLEEIARLIKIKKIDEAQFELSKLGPNFFKNTDSFSVTNIIFSY